MMTLFRQWELLELAVLPVLMAARPAGHIFAWNLGYLDDAMAVALAYLYYSREDAAARLTVFHSGEAPPRRPLEWSCADLRGVPRTPWMEPSATERARWRPRREILDAVVLGRPRDQVDLLIAPSFGPAGGPPPYGMVRAGGHVLLTRSPDRAPELADDLEPVDGSDRLFRKLSPARPGPAAGADRTDWPVSLAGVHQQAVLVESYSNLARSLARRFAGRGERPEDLEQVALTALVAAARRYDAGSERPFGPYATASILGELKRYFRDQGWALRVPRSVQERYLAVRTANDDLTQELGASPSILQLSRCTGISEEDILGAIEAGNNSRPTSLDVAPPGSDSTVTEVPVIEDGFERTLERRTLAASVHLLSPAERLIVRQVFYEGRTQRQVAEDLGVSQMQISRLARKAVEKIRGGVAVAQTARPAVAPGRRGPGWTSPPASAIFTDRSPRSAPAAHPGRSEHEANAPLRHRQTS